MLKFVQKQIWGVEKAHNMWETDKTDKAPILKENLIQISIGILSYKITIWTY